MTPFLMELFEGLDTITQTQADRVEPHEEPSEKDHVVGLASSDLRRLYCLFMESKKRELEAMAELMTAPKEQRDGCMTKVKCFYDRADIIGRIFWHSCRDEFSLLWDKPLIGIRSGWYVVWSDPEDRCSSVAEFNTVISPEKILGILRKLTSGETLSEEDLKPGSVN